MGEFQMCAAAIFYYYYNNIRKIQNFKIILEMGNGIHDTLED